LPVLEAPLEGSSEFIFSVDVSVSGFVPAPEPMPLFGGAFKDKVPGALLPAVPVEPGVPVILFAELHGEAPVPGVAALPIGFVLVAPFVGAVEFRVGVLPPIGAVGFVFPMVGALGGDANDGMDGAALPADGAAFA